MGSEVFQHYFIHGRKFAFHIISMCQVSFNFFINYLKVKNKSFLALRLHKNRWRLDLIHEAQYVASCPRLLFKWACSNNSGGKGSSLGPGSCLLPRLFGFFPQRNHIFFFFTFLNVLFFSSGWQERSYPPWVLFTYFITSAHLVKLHLNIYQ